MNSKKVAFYLCLAVLLLALAGCSSNNQPKSPESSTDKIQWPTKPVTWLVGASPGGATDLNARALTSAWNKYFDQPVVIECVSGGGGTVMMTQMQQSPADGTVIGSLAQGSTLIKPWQMELPYDPEKDFTYIAGYNDTGYFLTVPIGFPADNYEEFCTEIAENPGKYSYGQGSVGGLGHLITAVMLDKGEIIDKCEMIPYDSGGNALVALAGGHIDFAVLTPSEVAQYVQDGQFKLLAWSGSERNSLYPDVPCYAELGIEVISGIGTVCGPANMAPELVKEIEQTIKLFLEDPDVVGAFEKMGTADYLKFYTHEEVTEECISLYKNAGIILKKIGLID